ncbi:FtsH protease activity modulator HflK [Desertibacillus haloalkaliphilus]|uniref:FtsH protease activity modulator HflK n=1 Tax=Desertibacillus haloalkaliphilus TaxID=1328930 RepID=UPI001C25AEC7|nr:FtsH protease activity modulator HflK [Desertibacillus haloalkaliphilus]MBU8905150.1 FtsH protease activity modulator HflK [Desertibacillus haloalkaliphilus]
MVSIKQIIIGFVALIGVAILGLFLVTGWYTVDESEQAALITFGKVDEEVSEPGLHFKLPWPIQKVEVLSRETFSLRVGYDESDGEVTSYTDEAKMITGDENILFADLVVQWRITNPEQYLFNTNQPTEVLYNATSASLRSVIGSSGIDDALTDQRPEIEASVREGLTELIDTYEIGITIMDVKLQDVELPTEEVRRAFTEVTDAREERLTKINEAERYRNQLINEAEGEKDAIMSRAQGTRAERIERARGDVAMFEALYDEYIASPEVTRQRLVLETLERVLPGTEIYIMDSNNDTVSYLPIRPLERNAGATDGGAN